MTTQSFTGTINTQGTYQTLASISGLTFTSGKSYTIQITGTADLKIANAKFPLRDERFPFSQGDDTAYIKTGWLGATIAILENA